MSVSGIRSHYEALSFGSHQPRAPDSAPFRTKRRACAGWVRVELSGHSWAGWLCKRLRRWEDPIEIREWESGDGLTACRTDSLDTST
jgi:hypothetical protein